MPVRSTNGAAVCWARFNGDTHISSIGQVGEALGQGLGLAAAPLGERRVVDAQPVA